MNVTEVAERLVAHCRQGHWEAAQKELYANEAVSIEPEPTPAFPKETRGLSAIIEKGHKFESMVEQTHSIAVSAPLIAGDSFVFVLSMDLTMKGQGRMQMSELCVYETKDGKIVSERFFN